MNAHQRRVLRRARARVYGAEQFERDFSSLYHKRYELLVCNTSYTEAYKLPMAEIAT